jgi:prepilin-type N-terminal cleavage/methylation domain-containing protein
MSKRGFTLIEVLTTIAIIGILVAITTMVYSSSLKRSRDGQRKTDLDSIKNALEQYYLDNRNYPSFNSARGNIYNARWQFEAGLVSNCASNRAALAPLILPTIPEDPINKLPASVGGCNELTDSNLSGEYIYFVAGNTTPPNSDPRPKAGYYLLAKMETAPSVNINNNGVNDSSSITFIRNRVQGWGYDLSGIVIGNGISGSVTHNYFVNSKPNN